MKKVAIVQSNYIPWKGYFDMIASVDEFILYDDVQYTRRDWRNRNQIKTPQGLKWITVPVRVKGKYQQAIRETEIAGTKWMRKHWLALCANYCQTPFFREVSQCIEPCYDCQGYRYLYELNHVLIKAVCSYLGIKTKISRSWDYSLSGGQSEQLADLCTQAGGLEYVSGPRARSYLDQQAFLSRGIKVTWFSYDGYPEYPQLWGEFTHFVTILDLLFNCGKDSFKYMKYAPNQAA